MKNIYLNKNRFVDKKRNGSTKFILAGIVLVLCAFLIIDRNNDTSAEACTSSPCNTTFRVNVRETLSVSVTPPASWASGNTGNFLSNTVKVGVTTNNASGFIANMYSQGTAGAAATTRLANVSNNSYYIPTLSSSVTCSSGCTNFTANTWGYKVASSVSSSDPSTISSSPTSGTYLAMSDSSSPRMLINAASATSGTTSTVGSAVVDFGALINNSQASGTYVNTVLINVITQPSSNVAPSNPAVPTDDTPNDGIATYKSAANRTIYTTTSTNTTTSETTTTTQVTNGDVTGLYQAPAGETKKLETNVSGSQSATGLAVAAASAATGGVLFFVLAKRHEENEEDEQTGM